MGALLCCCRRRTRSYDHEQEPLLPKHNPPDNPLPPPSSQLEQLADAFAALRAGKLPSEAQSERILDAILKSGIFNVDHGDTSRALSERGRRVLHDAREVLVSIQALGRDKNGTFFPVCYGQSPMNTRDSRRYIGRLGLLSSSGCGATSRSGRRCACQCTRFIRC